MHVITINDDNLQHKDINKFGKKARAILVKDNKILLSNYGGVFLLPGGSIEKEETPDQAIVREISEETGCDYNINELKLIFTLNYYQPNYPTRNSEIINRMITTYYYIGQYKNIDIAKSHRTKEEIEDNFYLKLIELDELGQLLEKNISNNPRKKYFDREIIEVFKELGRIKNNS